MTTWPIWLEMVFKKKSGLKDDFQAPGSPGITMEKDRIN